jgi:hypothetical protein
MSYVPYKGGTLLVPSGPSGLHLFTVLTNKCEHGFHLWVSITSIKQGKVYDPACVYVGGEHAFITHGSYALYRLAEQKRAGAISNGVEKGYFIPKDDMQPEHLEKICAGIQTSEFVSPWVIEYFTKNKGL